MKIADVEMKVMFMRPGDTSTPTMDELQPRIAKICELLDAWSREADGVRIEDVISAAVHLVAQSLHVLPEEERERSYGSVGHMLSLIMAQIRNQEGRHAPTTH